MAQSVWKILSTYGEPTGPARTEDLDLALADVDASGAILHISSLGVQRWGWKTGDHVPSPILDALLAVEPGATRALAVQQGGLSLVGLMRPPASGWLLIGFSEEAERAEPASTFKSLIENGPVCLMRLLADGTAVDADAETEALTGYLPDDVIGRRFWQEVVHPEDRWKLTEALRRVADEQQKATLDLRFLGPHQELRLAKLYLMPATRLEDAEIEALVFDATQQGEIEEVLLQSEALYRTFLEQSPMGILHLDRTGVVTFENHAFRQIVGEAVEDAWIGRHLEDVAGLDAGLPPLVARMLAAGTPLRAEAVDYRRPGAGHVHHLVVHASPIRQAGGEIVGGVMMVEDVTEQRRREEELILRDRYEKAERALREAVLGDLNEAVFLHEAAEILGETAQADRIHLLVHLGDEGTCITRAAWVRDERDEPFSLFVRSADYGALRHCVVQGTNVYLRASDTPAEAQPLLALTEAEEVLWAPFYDAERLGGFVLFERTLPPLKGTAGFWDALEQRLMDHLVRLFETLWSWIQVGQRYRLTVATIDDCLFTFSYGRDGHRRYVFVTPQIEALTGYRAEAVLGRTDAALAWAAGLVHADDHDRLAAHDDALRAGRESKLTYRIRHADGTERWLCEQATPHRDATGRVTVSGILIDVTEQKDAEAVLQSAQEQVRSASRLKNSFVATMSHELRTPLGAVNGFAELLALELAEYEAAAGAPLPAQLHEFAEAVRQNARRVLRLADDLFVLSNMELGGVRLDRAEVPLHPLVQHALHTVGVAAAEKNVQLTTDLADADLTALGDAQRIEQILDHLLTNAVKFTDEGTITVRTYAAGEDVAVEVRDTGVGMEPAYLANLFTPFHQEDDRLNRSYEGSGLGLALTKRLLDLMGGRIEAESRKHEGSTFRVFLPAAGIGN